MATLTSDFATDRGSEVALIDEHRSETWADLDSRVNKLVNGLRARGLKAGDTVAIVAGNRCEWFELALACAHGGWTYVPVNWHWVADELAYVFEDADTVAVFVDERFDEQSAAALRDPRAVGVRIVVGIGTTDSSKVTGDSRYIEYESLIQDSSTEEPADQVLGGPMFYTSGTTGRPKGVRGMLSGNTALTPDIMKLIGASFSQFLPIPGRTLLCGPVYHSAQWAFSFLPMIRRFFRGDATQVRLRRESLISSTGMNARTSILSPPR